MSETAVETARSVAGQLVVFALGGEEYALPIAKVQEIIRYQEPRAVASESSWIRGVISLRGRIIPVCDLAERLGVNARQGDAAKIVIIETQSGSAGVVVDDVDEVLTIEESQLDEVPVASADFIEAIAKIGDRLVVLLDPDGIFADTELAT